MDVLDTGVLMRYNFDGQEKVYGRQGSLKKISVQGSA